MTKDLFYDWFVELFIPNCGKERPVILLLDNHDSHLSTKVIDAAKANQVEACVNSSSTPNACMHNMQGIELFVLALHHFALSLQFALITFNHYILFVGDCVYISLSIYRHIFDV